MITLIMPNERFNNLMASIKKGVAGITTILFFFSTLAIGLTLYKEQQIQQEKQQELYLDSLNGIKPVITYFDNQTFLDGVNQCIDYLYYNTVPKSNWINRELILAQAALESGWGTSRFGIEGNNLFGIRTYDLREPHMLPWKDKPKPWGVQVFMNKCDSVEKYINILNEGTHFEDYRTAVANGKTDSIQLLQTLDAYATDKNYFTKVEKIILKIRDEYKLNYLIK